MPTPLNGKGEAAVEKKSVNSEKPSRRAFAKAAVLALATAPLLRSAVKAQEQCPKITLYASPPPEVETKTDHIPPTVIGDWGSFFIELEHELVYSKNQGGDRPYVYVAEVKNDVTGAPEPLKQYGSIAWVQVITEYEKRYTYWRYDIPESLDARLRLWLMDDAGTLSAKPLILIKGQGQSTPTSLKGLWVEMQDKKLKKTQDKIKKARRKKKHEHEDNGSKVFRAGKWDLVKGDPPNETVIFPGEVAGQGNGDITGFKFMIAFGHVRMR
jgi:hypothetical protein